MKIIIDTNILIDAMVDDFSYTWKIIDLVLAGEIEAIASEKILRENRLIIDRQIINVKDKECLEKFFNAVKIIQVNKKVLAVLDDPEDNKFIECALEAAADYIISSDKHLLFLENYDNVKILSPKDFWLIYTGQKEDSGEEWKKIFKNILGI